MPSIDHIDYLLNDLAALRTALTEALEAREATLTPEQRVVAYEALMSLKDTIDAHNPELVALETATAAVLTLLAESWSSEHILTLED